MILRWPLERPLSNLLMVCFGLFSLSFFTTVAHVQAQEIPQSIQQEIRQRGMTPAQARQEAQRLGIDLSNPTQAAQRARELGVPESLIQEMLQAVQEEQLGISGDSEVQGTPTPAEALPTVDLGAQRTATIAARDQVEAQTETPLEDVSDAQDLPYFGYDTFTNIPEAFQPNAVGPVDDGYLVGPGDELRLTVWGAAEFQYTLPVDIEGRVFIPRVGQLTVAGERLARLREDMKRSLSRSYAGLTTDPPTVFMDLTLARIRPIHVYVLGEVGRPGGYTVSSFSTLFNVLYSVGGPLTRGSLRDIQVRRNGRVVATSDFYSFLLEGSGGNGTRLQTNDFIFIPPRGKTIAVSGQVRRPAIYEMKGNEGVAKLISFAGGLLPEAYTKRFQIERIIPFEERTDPSIGREVLDLDLAQIIDGRADVTLRDGDQVRIFSIVNELDNAVTIEGQVFQPGRYELSTGLRTVKDLIEEADGLNGRAYRDKADLIRTHDDYTEETYSLDLNRVMAGDPAQNLVLMKRDRLTVYSVRSLFADGSVSITGQVRSPGPKPYRDNLTLYDLLFQGGGLQDTLYLKTVFKERADLFRRMPDGHTEQIIPFNLQEALSGRGAAATLLRPNDEVRIYPLSVEVLENRFVNINGAVKNPGSYRYRDNMTLEDLILQAGGFQESAYLLEAEVARLPDPEGPGTQTAELISVLLADERDGEINFDIESSEGVFTQARAFRLRHRDQVSIMQDPEFRPLETVVVSGEVEFPGSYTLREEGETLGQVVARAGGIKATGYAGGGRLTRGGQNVITDFREVLNGSRSRDIVMQDGDVIMVPSKPGTVSISGNVNNPGLVKFARGRRVNYYLDRAGGTGENTQDIFLTQASGATYKLRRGIFPQNPVVDEGATISVTQKEEREREPFDLGETITTSVSVLASVLTVLVLALQATK